VIDDSDTVLSFFSLRHAALEERFAAARAAGFKNVGLYTKAFAAAEAGGLSPEAQRRMADRYGVRVTDIEALRAWSGDRDQEDAEATAFRMADTFGARYVQVVGPCAGPFEAAAEVLASLCDRAAEHGLTVGLEFLPYTNIPDAATAAALCAAADRPNCGVCVDSWHHFRGANDNGQLRSLRPELVTGVQLNDGGLQPEDSDYVADTLANRKVPGEGEFDLVGFMRTLDAAGVTAPVSLEVISTVLEALPAAEAATRIHAGFRRVLAEARR
jgi:sugar phosphate isomerase/epimerase